jgi:hypothetical protein
MLRGLGVEQVAGQQVYASQDRTVAHSRGNRDRPSIRQREQVQRRIVSKPSVRCGPQEAIPGTGSWPRPPAKGLAAKRYKQRQGNSLARVGA